jgi:hypothetical protein
MAIVHTAGDGKKHMLPVYLLVVLVRDTACMSTLLAMIERDRLCTSANGRYSEMGYTLHIPAKEPG